jgi:ABC-type oligopeptide transport system ATPase subunit
MIISKLYKTKAERMARVAELMELVGLDPSYVDRYPHEFSGGQRQRIVIARALATNPELLVCDEAVSALDVSVRAQILNLLEDLQDKLGLTYLFISHDLSLVARLCDRVLVLKNGKVVERGTQEDIFYHPKEEYTKQLMVAAKGKQLAGTNQKGAANSTVFLVLGCFSVNVLGNGKGVVIFITHFEKL